MPRYRVTIEYDGTAYSGWQRQADRPSIQAALEDALFKFTGETRVCEPSALRMAAARGVSQMAQRCQAAREPAAGRTRRMTAQFEIAIGAAKLTVLDDGYFDLPAGYFLGVPEEVSLGPTVRAGANLWVVVRCHVKCGVRVRVCICAWLCAEPQNLIPSHSIM